MANAANCIQWVLRQEDATLAGKVENLGDGAGITRFGITSKNFPSMPDGFYSSMPTVLALQCAIDHYTQNDWTRIRGDEITLNDVAGSMLSFCINGGDTTEIEICQRAFGLTVDGVVGNLTLEAWNGDGAGDKIRAAQAQHYKDIYNANPLKNQRWIHGWLNRAARVYPNLVP